MIRILEAGFTAFISISGLLLGVFIYAMVLFTWGDTYLPNKNVENGVICSDFALSQGFENGDKIISVDGEGVSRFLEINENSFFLE